MTAQKILIVGGVAGGASAAARLRRLDETAEIILFERGEYISFANCGLPYYVGEVITDRDKLLVQSEQGMEDRFAIDVRPLNEVTSINRNQKTVLVKDHKTGQEYSETYDKLVLSPGAAPIIPDFGPSAGEGIFSMRNMADVDRMKTFVDGKKPKSAVVIGAGFVGVEIAENLCERGIDVSLIEVSEYIMRIFDKEMAKPLEAELAANGIDVLTNEKVVKIASLPSGEGYHVEMEKGNAFDAEMIVYALGVRPETALAKQAGLEIGELGGIRVNEHMLASDPNIFAVGDAIEVKNLVMGSWQRVPLAGPANKQGRIAADNIAGRNSIFKGSQATAVIKIFGLTAAFTGCNEAQLKQAGIDYLKSYTISGSHAGYYPEAFPITMKLLFTVEGRILGAQAFGRDGVDKRIDVLAAALRNGLTVYDLEELEHAYAPPFSSAKDPVNMAGFTAANILQGDVQIVHWNEIAALAAQDDYFLLDVRTPLEFSLGAINGAVNIELDELRKRMAEIPKEKKILLYCRIGLRGYVAARLLMQYGFDVYNLSGGYEVYLNGMSEKPECVRNNKETNEGAPYITDSKASNCQINQDTIPAAVITIDACGISCPGPIMKLNEAVAKLNEGQVVEVHATDPAFAVDAQAWSKKTGNSFLSKDNKDGKYIVRVMKGVQNYAAVSQTAVAASQADSKTMVVFSGDYDKAMASFIIANGAAAMGSKVTMFFTFWGLNILRRAEGVAVKKNLIEKMFGMMMPRGANRLKLSKMNMGGMGQMMIKHVMRSKNVMSIDSLISEAQKAGVRFIACQMSMDVMGIKQEEMIDGVEIGGVAAYLGEADQSNVNLFI